MGADHRAPVGLLPRVLFSLSFGSRFDMLTFRDLGDGDGRCSALHRRCGNRVSASVVYTVSTGARAMERSSTDFSIDWSNFAHRTSRCANVDFATVGVSEFRILPRERTGTYYQT